MNKESVPYKALCTEFYELDKPNASEDALQCYLLYAEEAQGKILEPSEIEQLLAQENLKIVGRWQAEPYIRAEANNTNPVILYECMKN